MNLSLCQPHRNSAKTLKPVFFFLLLLLFFCDFACDPGPGSLQALRFFRETDF